MRNQDTHIRSREQPATIVCTYTKLTYAAHRLALDSRLPGLSHFLPPFDHLKRSSKHTISMYLVWTTTTSPFRAINYKQRSFLPIPLKKRPKPAFYFRTQQSTSISTSLTLPFPPKITKPPSPHNPQSQTYQA
ncbi:unnamed protein product [Periconia digitata]|uniref:Uncharacterized protein n=1 Tax=Periconia digitata TaxID=1303443 RepID=A0A9W4XRV1_9PLEO|nr:unnamed protein product [Periconia digitata]